MIGRLRTACTEPSGLAARVIEDGLYDDSWSRPRRHVGRSLPPIAIEIEPAGIFGYSTTRVLAIDGATAYIAQIRDHSYQIERDEVPPITC